MHSPTSSYPVQHSGQQAVDFGVARQPARRVGVLVLGMHRSGSSAITRMLSLLGCDLPRTQMAGNSSNPTGHWESDPIAHFNDEVFSRAGTSWHDWLPLNPRLAETQIWPSLVARGRELLREEFANAPLFVLKDPRICKLAPLWREVLEAEGIDPVFVLPLRNPIEVARSLAARDGFDQQRGLLIWLRHVLAAEAATRGQPRVFTDYTSLLNDWETLAVRSSDALGVVWPRLSVLSGEEISQFLTPDLRHHVSATAEVTTGPSISPWIAKAYEVLLAWARHGESAADFSVLDTITRAFDEAGVAFARPMLNIAVAEQRLAQVEMERAALAQERNGLAMRLCEIEGEMAAGLAQRDAFAEEHDTSARLLGDVETKLLIAVEQRDLLAAERDRIAQQLGKVEAELTVSLAQNDAFAEERSDAMLRRKEIETELTATIQQRDLLAEERDRSAWNLDKVAAELAKSIQQQGTLIEERDKSAWWLGEARAELAMTIQQRDLLAEERDKIAWRLGEVGAHLASAHADRDALSIARDRLAGECTSLADERSKIAWRLGEVDGQLIEARTLQAAASARVNKLEEELAKAGPAIDALKHRSAVAESTLRQREEEIAQLGAELAKIRAESIHHAATAAEARELAARLTLRLAEEQNVAEQRLALVIVQADNEAQRLREALLVSESAHVARASELERELARARADQRTAEQHALRAEAETAGQTRLAEERDAQLGAAQNALAAAAAEALAQRARADQHAGQAGHLAWHQLNDRIASGRTDRMLDQAQRKLAHHAARRIAFAGKPYGRLLRKLGLGYGLAARMGRDAELIETFLDDLPWPLVGVHPEGRRARVLTYLAGASDFVPDFPFVRNSEYLQLYPDVGLSGRPALLHFIEHGQAEERAPLPLFDSAWYLARYPEARHVAPSALVHYLKWGVAKGFDPHPLFSTRAYQARYADVGTNGRNPLLHWIENPRCTAHPLFDADFYLNTYGDVADAGCNALHHYLAIGWREGRNPHPLFDTDYYLAGVPDLRAQGVCPLVHYVESGWRDRRRSVPGFDPIFYQSAYPDLGPEVDLLLHYIEHGRAEGRLPRESRPFVAPAPRQTVAITRPAAPVDSENLPVALMIDAFYPRPDHDSGSLDQISFVRIFQRLGFDVHFLSLLDFHRDHQDDTPCYRQSLRDMGITTITSEDYPFVESYYFDQSERITVVFGSRVHFGGNQLAILRQLCPAARTIFNTVDLHFIRQQREGELKNDPAILLQAAQTRDLECAISSNADATIVVSTSEKDILGQLEPEANITVVPLIREFAVPSGSSFASRSAIGFIGGFMHQPNIDAVEHFLDSIWPGLHRRRPDIIFRVIGADMPATMRERRIEGVEFVGYVEDLEAELAKLRLTIAPLRFGAGAKGKLVSSLGSGVPSVVSNVAVEGMGLVDGETVLVAEMDSRFADQIIRLYDDQALWQRLSDAGLALIRRDYSLDKGTSLMREILTGIGVEPPRDG